jgi:hypothetical protein
MKCFENVKSFCQFRKELINNQAILYQVFSAEEDRLTREENFIDISQAVKIKLEVAENDSYNSNEIFEPENTMHEGELDHGADGTYQHFKIEGHGPDGPDELGLYSELFKLAYLLSLQKCFLFLRFVGICRYAHYASVDIYAGQNNNQEKTTQSFG